MAKLVNFILKEFFLFFVYVVIALIIAMCLWWVISSLLPLERLFHPLLSTFQRKSFVFLFLFLLILIAIYFYRFLTGAIKQALGL